MVKTAAQIIDGIYKKHGIQKPTEEQKQKREQHFKQYAYELEKVDQHLKKHGVKLTDLGTDTGKIRLYSDKSLFNKIKEELCSMYFNLKNVGLRETIVRFLSVPWSGPEVAKLFIKDFKYSPSDFIHKDLKWAIGNALYVFANDEVCDEIISIVTDKKHGRTREMAVAALGRMKEPQNKEKAVNVLIDLLKDEDVAGHALMALRKIKATGSRQQIEPFLSHSKTWWRNEAKKAIATFDKIETINTKLDAP